MTAIAAITTSALACPTCSGPVDVGSRHVSVAGGTVRVYCSADCLRGVSPVMAPVLIEAPEQSRRARWWLLAILLFGGAGLGVGYVARTRHVDTGVVPAPEVTIAAEPQPPVAPATAVLDAVRQREQDSALLAELGHDTWIHPLAGPSRRMPVNHNGAFGAERAGDRPPECVSGHCGVDLGHTWGEPVHAVHEGVVDFVQRGSNDEHGGMFVRIAHRDGTLFSWYFHLCAIPRSITTGTKITAGQVIGLLGDTGVVRSGPHLHFSLSVKPSKSSHERYLDPEPLIAIWPLWIPTEEGSGHVSTSESPGLPVRERARRKRKPAPVATEPASETGSAEQPASP
jgi:murein DD-endopeptidase MepM/ murein hydrolase activator NlpD